MPTRKNIQRVKEDLCAWYELRQERVCPGESPRRVPTNPPLNEFSVLPPLLALLKKRRNEGAGTGAVDISSANYRASASAIGV